MLWGTGSSTKPALEGLGASKGGSPNPQQGRNTGGWQDREGTRVLCPRCAGCVAAAGAWLPARLASPRALPALRSLSAFPRLRAPPFLTAPSRQPPCPPPAMLLTAFRLLSNPALSFCPTLGTRSDIPRHPPCQRAALPETAPGEGARSTGLFIHRLPRGQQKRSPWGRGRRWGPAAAAPSTCLVCGDEAAARRGDSWHWQQGRGGHLAWQHGVWQGSGEGGHWRGGHRPRDTEGTFGFKAKSPKLCPRPQPP